MENGFFLTKLVTKTGSVIFRIAMTATTTTAELIIIMVTFTVIFLCGKKIKAQGMKGEKKTAIRFERMNAKKKWGLLLQ